MDELEAENVMLRTSLEIIAQWRSVNLMGEYEGGLRDIIRSLADCAASALETSWQVPWKGRR